MKTKFKFIKKLKNEKGFSLVELMVVVAIIGILAAIAIPNYQKFQRKSQQVEAKTMMSGLYANQITFMNEWNALSAAFDQIGFEAIGDSPKYTVGWVTGSAFATNAAPTLGYRGPQALGNTSVVNTGGGTVNTAAAGPPGCRNKAFCDSAKLLEAFATNVTLVQVSGTCAGSCSSVTGLYVTDTSDISCVASCGTMTDGKIKSDGREFVIGAAGDIGGKNPDLWYMDYNKIIQNVKSGL